MLSKLSGSEVSLIATIPPFFWNFSGAGGSEVSTTDSAPVLTMNKCSHNYSFIRASIAFLFSSLLKDSSNLSDWILFFMPNIHATLSLKYFSFDSTG